MMVDKLIERFKDAYSGKKVLVTGADGFMGSHLSETLLKCGAKVGLYVRGSARLGCGVWDFRCIEEPPEKFDAIIAGDISSPDTVSQIINYNPEIILHLAAIAYVNYSFTNPEEVFQVNAGGTLRVLEAARRMPDLKRLVVTSSSEIYGTRQADTITEEHPLNPTSPYAASKAAADRLAYSYRVTYGMPIVIARPFNTYGPRHTYDVIPKFIRLALANEPLTIYGDGNQERDFSYVTDTVQGFLLSGAHPNAIGGIFNFGYGESVSINYIAEQIVKISGSSSPIIHIAPREAEVQCLLSNITKAKTVLGFQPQVSLVQGLTENIEWAKKHLTK